MVIIFTLDAVLLLSSCSYTYLVFIEKKKKKGAYFILQFTFKMSGKRKHSNRFLETPKVCNGK